MQHRIPTNAPTRWNFSSRAIFTVGTYRKKLIEVFDYISESEDFLNDDQSLRAAYGLKSLLLDNNFIFFLKVFRMIFEQTDVVFQILQNKLTDITHSKNRLKSLLLKLKEFRNNEIHFNTLYKIFLEDTEGTFDDDSEPQRKKRKTSLNFDRADIHYKQIFAEILDTIIVQIEIRFSDLNTLECFDLVNYNNFESFSKSFPSNLLDQLINQYPCFDPISLKNELSVLYTDQQLLGTAKMPQEMLMFISNNNLKTCLSELSKLLSLVLTIPVTSASVERSFSALKRIKTFTRNTMAQDRLSNISIISIEKRFLSEFKKNDSFYEEVINHFASFENRRLPLIYKHV